ncbi:MAG TPA: Pycsar system effector family protein [Vicinamibacterales bacterium]|nr:Pycsar system effector family protein [Vicinamibacterales bacterium]
MLPVSDLESILKRVQEWIWRLDTKVNILIALEALGATTLGPRVLLWLPNRSPLVTWVAGAGLGFVCVSALKNVQALFPRLAPFDLGRFLKTEIWGVLAGLVIGGRKPPAPTSVTFFGHIGAMKLDEFRRRVNEMDSEGEEWREEFIQQIHINSVIANKKFHDFKVATTAFVVGVALLATAYWLNRLGM